MSSELDKDILSVLTDEEREAISGGDMSPEDKAALQAIAGEDEGEGDGADEGEGEGEDKSTDEGEDKSADKSDDKSADKSDDKAPADAAVDTAPAFRASYKAELPVDYANRLAEIKNETEALAKAFREGDIDFDEFQVKSQDISERREALAILRVKSEISEEMAVQTAEQEWANTIRRFFVETAKAGGTDYANDMAKQADLDQFVKLLASNPANADKSGEWYLAEAHKRVNALHGLIAKPEVSVPQPKRTKPAIPATSLAHVPGSEGPGDLAGEFASLDRLDGDALEIAIASMTKAQREKYSMGA